jgi:hypothetical protein
MAIGRSGRILQSLNLNPLSNTILRSALNLVFSFVEKAHRWFWKVSVVYKLLSASITKRCGTIGCIRNSILVLVHSESTYDLKVSFWIWQFLFMTCHFSFFFIPSVAYYVFILDRCPEIYIIASSNK